LLWLPSHKNTRGAWNFGSPFLPLLSPDVPLTLEYSLPSCRDNTAPALSYNPTHTLIAYRLPFEAIHIFLILKYRVRPCVPERMAAAKKLHAEGNLHPARVLRISGVRGPEVCEMRDSTQLRELWQQSCPVFTLTSAALSCAHAVQKSAWTLIADDFVHPGAAERD